MERNAKFDNVKFFLICCVVFGHIANSYAENDFIMASMRFWIYLFHMPAFIFVAGLFSKRTIEENRWYKLVPYIFLFIMMKMNNYVLACIFAGINNASVDFFHEDGIPWFALSMFWWGAITILVKRVKPLYVIVVSVLLAVVSGYSAGVNGFLVMQRTLVFFPFFYLGYLTDIDLLSSRLDRIHWKITSAVVLVATAVVVFLFYNDIYFWRFLFLGFEGYHAIHKGLPYAWGGTWRIIAYLISMLLTLAIICLAPKKKSILSTIGRKTLPIFVFHQIIHRLAAYFIPGFRTWMLAGPTSLKCFGLMLVLVALTSTPVFDLPLRKLMTVPLRPPSVPAEENSAQKPCE